MVPDIRPIYNETDYELALKEVEPYFENEPSLGTPESERFDVLVSLIRAYKRKYYPIPDV